MPEFVVPVVRKELRSLWYEFWESEKPTARARAANKNGSLGQTKLVRAKNMADAMRVAENENPGYVAVGKPTRL